MAYSKLNLTAGNKIEASQINHIDLGVAKNDAALAKKLGWTLLWNEGTKLESLNNKTYTVANLNKYKLLAIITSHGTFFYSTYHSKSSMYYIAPNTSYNTLRIYVRTVSHSSNKITFSQVYVEYIHNGSSYTTSGS